MWDEAERIEQSFVNPSDAGAKRTSLIAAAPARALSRTTPKTLPRATAPPSAPALADLARIRLIEQAFEELRPSLKADGGDCELVAVEGASVFVRLKGACVGCQLASVTLGGIRQRLSAELGMPLRVIPVGKTGH